MKRREDFCLSGDLIAEPQLCCVCAQLTHKVTLIAEPRLTGCGPGPRFGRGLPQLTG